MTDELDLETLLLLRAARETEALEALMTTAETPAALAAETGITDRAARVLVDALEAEGFLERVDGSSEPTNRALGFLAKTDVRSIGPVPARLDALDRGLALPETMRSGEPPAESAVETRNRLGAAAATDEATVRAVVTAAIRTHPDAARVVDVGGAPGRYAREFAARGLEVTLFDRSDRLEGAAGVVVGTDVSTVEGAVPGPIPETDVDLAFVADLSHRLGPDANREVVDAAFDALAPGGRLVLIDRVRGRSPGWTAAAIAGLAETDAGRAYPVEDYREWLADAGFAGGHFEDVPGTDRGAIVGRRPPDE